MLKILSKIKSKLWRLLSYRVYISDLQDVLSYPHDHVDVDEYIKKLPLKQQAFIAGDNFDSSIGLIDLKARYMYLNSRNRFSESLLPYRRILAKESRWTGLMRAAGLRKRYMAKFLLSERNTQDEIESLNSFLNTCKYHEGYNQKFEELVGGKRIALVGGAPSDEINGDIIDRFDLVVRINANTTSQFDQSVLGKRCDIIYVRGERGQLILEHPRKYFSAAESKKAVYRFKVKQQLSQLPYMPESSIASNYDEVFDYGHLNAVQSAILDLLLHGALSIKIFNVDFNLSGAAFSGYRPSNLEAVQFEKIFVAHPPHPQFDLCKRCYELGILSGDDKFETIIKSDMHDFITKCDKRWSLENR